MLVQSSLALFLLMAMAANLVGAIMPPGCLIKAVNENNKEPGDVPAVCANPKMPSALNACCGGATQAAVKYFDNLCGNNNSSATPTPITPTGTKSTTLLKTYTDTACSCMKTSAMPTTVLLYGPSGSARPSSFSPAYQGGYGGGYGVNGSFAGSNSSVTMLSSPRPTAGAGVSTAVGTSLGANNAQATGAVASANNAVKMDTGFGVVAAIGIAAMAAF